MTRTVVIAAACLLALSGCTATPTPAVTSTAPTTGTVKGTATVTDSGNIRASSQGLMPCSLMTDGGYSDFHTGAEVDVVDASGKVLAFGSLEPGSTPSTDDLGNVCAFRYTITGVPRGKKVYGVEFGRRGIVHFKEAAIFGGHADITAGN